MLCGSKFCTFKLLFNFISIHFLHFHFPPKCNLFYLYTIFSLGKITLKESMEIYQFLHHFNPSHPSNVNPFPEKILTYIYVRWKIFHNFATALVILAPFFFTISKFKYWIFLNSKKLNKLKIFLLFNISLSAIGYLKLYSYFLL